MAAAVAALVMAMGLAGTVVPGVPGLPLVWAAALGYGLAVGFGATGTVAMVVVTALAVAGMAAAVVLPGRAAAATRAARSSLVLAAVAGVVGFFVVPVIGFAVFGTVALYVAERARTGDARAAWQATRATLVGFGLGAAAELAAGMAMVVTWLVWVLVA